MNYRTHLIKWNYLLNKMTSKTEKKKTLKKRKKKYTNLVHYRISPICTPKEEHNVWQKKNLFLLHMIWWDVRRGKYNRYRQKLHEKYIVQLISTLFIEQKLEKIKDSLLFVPLLRAFGRICICNHNNRKS